MQHFLKSQLFPTCSIRTKHAKWACNILTFVPCGIWGHKCPAYHNTHLHSSYKSGPSPGEHTSPIRNLEWQEDRLPDVTELVSPALHTSAHLPGPAAPTHLTMGESGSFPTCVWTDGRPYHAGSAIPCEKAIRLPRGLRRPADSEGSLDEAQWKWSWY